MTKHIKRSTAILLVVITIISMFSMALPMQVSAVTTNNADTETIDDKNTDDTDSASEESYDEIYDSITDKYGEVIANEDVGEILSYSGYMLAADYSQMLYAAQSAKAVNSVGAKSNKTYTPEFWYCYDTSNDKSGLITIRQSMINHIAGNPALWMTIAGKSVFCIEPGKDLYQSTKVTDTSKAWTNLGSNKQNAIQLAISISNTKHKAGVTYPQQYTYQGTTRLSKYDGEKLVSGVKAEQAHIATQLIIWEIVKGERRATAPYALNDGKSGYLNMYCKGGANGNIKKAYNDILKQMKDYSTVPSFMGKSKDSAPTIKLSAKVTRSVNGSDKWIYSSTTVTDANKLLSTGKYSLASTYKNDKVTISVTRSGDKVTFKVTKAAAPASGTNSYSTTVTGEMNGQKIKSDYALVAYGDSGSTDIQDVVTGGSFIAPKAYIKLKVDVSSDGISRDGNVQKAIYTGTYEGRKKVIQAYSKAGRDGKTMTEDTIIAALPDEYKDNAGISEDLEGWYYFVTVPGEFASSYTRDRYPGIVLGPTNKQGITNSISDYIKAYFNSDIKFDIPEGKYQVFELGKLNDTSTTTSATGVTVPKVIKTFVDTKPKTGEDRYWACRKLADAFSIPDNYLIGQSYNFKNALQAFPAHEYYVDGGLTAQFLNLTGATTEVTSVSLNWLVPPLKITKSCEDGATPEGYYFEMKNTESGKSKIIGPTDSKGSVRIYQPGVASEEAGKTPTLEYECGTYTVTELGLKNSDGTYSIPEWYIAPDPIEIEISADAYVEAQAAGYDAIQLNFENRCQGKVAVHKTDSITGENVPNTEYAIYSDKDLTTVVQTITTDRNGYAESVPIALGTYYVKESKSSKTHVLNEEVYTVEVKAKQVAIADNIYTVETTDNPLIKLQLMKASANPSITDDNACYSLENAVYNIYTDKKCTDSSKIGSIKTDKDGYGCYGSGSDTNTDIKDAKTVAYKKNSGKSLELKPGVTYYCREATAPKNYLLDTTIYQFKNSGSVTSTGIKIYRAVHPVYNTQPKDTPGDDPLRINIYKRIEGKENVKSNTLNGAIFRVSYYDTMIDKDVDVTDDTPAEDIPKLDSDNLKRVWYIQTKTAGDTPGFAELSNAYIYNDATYHSQPLYTNEGSVVLPLGTVVVEEVQAPNGYFINNTILYRRIVDKDADITEDNKPIEIPIDEQPANGYIGLHKMNQAGDNVPGAQYGLYSDEACTDLISRLTTTDTDKGDVFKYTYDGKELKLEINKTYYIKEIKAPENTSYALDETVYPITATDDNLTVETAVIQDIYEDSDKGNIVVNKKSNDGLISNLWFALVDDRGNEYPAKVTNSKGTVKWTGLPIVDNNGKKIKYTVKELGFKMASNLPRVTVYDQIAHKDVEAYKHSYSGMIWYTYVNSCITYKGVKYEPAGAAGNMFPDVTGTSASGLSRYTQGGTSVGNTYGFGAKFDTLTSGEIKAGIELSEDGKTLTYNFDNKIPVLDIKLQKKSYEETVKDFYFEIYDNYNNLITTLCTDENGNAEIKDLPACLKITNSGAYIPIKYKAVEKGFKQSDGTYYLPPNYKKAYESRFQSGQNNTDTYTDDDKIIHYVIAFNVYNDASTGAINIQKRNNDDNIIKDIGFKIEAFDGDKPTIMGYDKDGMGIYSITVTTDENGKASSNDVTFYNTTGNKELDGLLKYVEVNDQQASNARKFITYRVTELGIKQTDGRYVFPENYKLVSPEYYTLEDDQTVEYTCTNEVIYGDAMLYKTTPDGESLDGSEWQLYNADTNKLIALWEDPVNTYEDVHGIYDFDENGNVTTLKTDSTGFLWICDIPVGNYYLVECNAPDGYMPYGDKISFSVVGNKSPNYSGNHYVFDATVPNYASNMPNTGKAGLALIYMSGATLAALAVSTFIVYRRRRKQK